MTRIAFSNQNKNYQNAFNVFLPLLVSIQKQHAIVGMMCGDCA
jgi:hypothetical protein